MTRRTYNPDDYEPEVQAAVKELRLRFDPGEWSHDDVIEVADIIKKVARVTEEKVRAACAAVAEAHLANPNPGEEQ